MGVKGVNPVTHEISLRFLTHSEIPPHTFHTLHILHIQRKKELEKDANRT
jgi:hypothetical protein